jgi:ribulose-5-phosphate 4-epimerase/fuculose-1-phosphate aldolase
MSIDRYAPAPFRRPLLGIVGVVLALSTAAAQGPSTSSEKALIDELVLANRMLASQEIGFLDALGHVSVRSRTNPNRFYISRFIAPGLVTAADIVENDLESNAVGAERKDEYQERFIHGEIYKSRPDVMAVVHSHTPELVAFGISSVRLRAGDRELPVYDIRKDNEGRFRIVDNPALARSMAQALGKDDALLLWGHGAVVVSSSVYGVVSAANSLRVNAQLQQQLIAMGGTFDSNPRRVAANAPPAGLRQVVVPNGTGGGSGGDRAWEYWKQLVAPGITGPNRIPRSDVAAASAQQETINNLVLANRILSSRELGILDASGHVSVRDPRNPNHYYISRYVSAGVVKASDIIENDLDSKPVAGPRPDEYQEVYMHGAIYTARPDVMAVLHSHTSEFVAFSDSSVALRPVVNQGRFIGEGLPLHDIRKFDPRETIIRTPALGQSVADALGTAPGVLLKGHGIALTGPSVQDLVVRAYNLRMNARIQQQAIALRGQVTYLDGQPASPNAEAMTAGSGSNRSWEYWKQMFRN